MPVTTSSVDENINPETVSILPISQANPALFPDMFFQQTVLVFILSGSKRVLCPHRGEMTGRAGDLFVFPAHTTVSLENRPIANAQYRADGVCFADDLVGEVFGDHGHQATPGITLIANQAEHAAELLTSMHATLRQTTLPSAIRKHRLLEPLVWLKSLGAILPTRGTQHPAHQVRSLIQQDLEHDWRAAELADHFAMSEASFRRWLAAEGQKFSRILRNTRLEYGLTQLQTTNIPVTEIALKSGFKTPSHFADSFKKRFGIPPNAIRNRDI